MDVVSGAKALAFLKTLPNWKFSPTPMKHFGVGITAKLQSIAPDGRLLLVEVLQSVAGLDAADLRRVSEVEVGGIKYRLLDPIAMLKAKAYNVRKFKYWLTATGVPMQSCPLNQRLARLRPPASGARRSRPSKAPISGRIGPASRTCTMWIDVGPTDSHSLARNPDFPGLSSAEMC